MFPILNPPPSSLPVLSLGSSQCTSPKHPVSCIKPGLVIRFICDVIHVSMPFSQIIPSSPSPRVQKTVLYICVSFAPLFMLRPPPHQKTTWRLAHTAQRFVPLLTLKLWPLLSENRDTLSGITGGDRELDGHLALVCHPQHPHILWPLIISVR